MSQNRGEAPSFHRGQRRTAALHVLLSAAAAALLLVEVNYFAARRNHRFEIGAPAGGLSPLTVNMLERLAKPVKVVVFFDRREPLFGNVSALIREYAAQSRQIQVEFVDYKMPGRAERIRAEYELASAGDTSRVIFDSGGRVRTVLASELSDYKVEESREVRRVGFKGEHLFTSAIRNVSTGMTPRALFLEGHGENDPSNTDDQRGFSKLAGLFRENGFEVGRLGGLASSPVPDDCDLLVIAAPQTTLDAAEVGRVRDYLARGGRLWLMFSFSSLGTPSGLEPLLAEWGLGVGSNWVQDQGESQSGEPNVLLGSRFGGHPVTRPLLRSSVKLVLPRAVQSIRPRPATASVPSVTELINTSQDGVLLVPVDRNRAEVRHRGSISVASASEWNPSGTNAVPSRIVAVGDSFFLANVMIEQAANRDFAQMTINWLANRDQMLNEIGPKPIREYQVTFTSQEMRRVRWILLAGLPGLALTLGLTVWARRRT